MKIYNSKTRRKEEFVPITPGKVGIYACGPTVYNYFHIGNARPLILFDILRRHLEKQGYKVKFVQNFTDIDDKMIHRANEEGITVKELGERFITEYMIDAQGLGVRAADIHPKATEHIGEIIGLIRKLEKKGFAYSINGDVYFDTQNYPEYGQLSGQNLEDLESGARIDVDELKKNPMDFALWKAQKEGEPAWQSPWGMGRPGWHIECSAMSMKYLGETFDIHCGGQDLLFPHHENEAAQSGGATGKPIANYWMHNGFINIDNQKMSKSLNNFFTVRDISKQYDLEIVRMFMLSSHYRSPVNFTQDLIEQAKAALERLYIARNNMYFIMRNAPERPDNEAEKTFSDSATCFVQKFDDALNDDLNTAEAIGVLFEYVKEANIIMASNPSKATVHTALKTLGNMTDVLGILTKEDDLIDQEILDLVDARQAARKNKDFKLADEIRGQITQRGYILEDTAQGPKVRIG